jgi:hypothetical protein
MDSVKASLVGTLRRTEPDPDELEAGLNRLIERRATDREQANAEAESWKATTAAFNAEHREARRHMWIGYYRRLSESFRRRSEECAERAAALDPGEGGS